MGERALPLSSAAFLVSVAILSAFSYTLPGAHGGSGNLPPPTIISPDHSNATWQNTSGNVTFDWSLPVNRSQSTFQLLIEGDNSRNITGNSTSTDHMETLLSDGSSTWKVRYCDPNSTWSNWSQEGVINIDTTAPINPNICTDANAMSDVWIRDNDPLFDFNDGSDPTSGVDHYLVYFGTNLTGTSTNQTTSSSHDPGTVSTGIHYLRVSTVDRAGNNASWATLFIYKHDGEGPSGNVTITETSATNGVWTTHCYPCFTWTTVTDEHSGMRNYLWKWGPYCSDSGYGGTSAYLGPQTYPGKYYFTVTPRDMLGNEGNTVRFNFWLDSRFPSNPYFISENSTESGVWQNHTNSPQFSWSNGTDIHSGIKGYYAYFGSNSGGTSSTLTNLTSLHPGKVGNGTYYLRLSTIDNVDQQKQFETKYLFMYDSRAPLNPSQAVETGNDITVPE